jgi:hypothetical protein
MDKVRLLSGILMALLLVACGGNGGNFNGGNGGNSNGGNGSPTNDLSYPDR